jgi:hypothetical protein
MKVLSRINPNEGYHRVVIARSSSDEPVISGLSVTPSDIERLARQGVPVSVPNANSFYNIDSGLNPDLIYGNGAAGLVDSNVAGTAPASSVPPADVACLALSVYP